MRAVVIGAGIAGLTAAWELARAGHEVTVFESERRAGGMIVTERVDGFVVEGGPDSFLTSEPDLPSLAQELGIAGRVVDQTARGAALWNGKALDPIAPGRAAALLGIETTGGTTPPGFRSFAGGMAEPVESLVGRLGTSLRFAQGASGIVPAGKGWRIAITGGAASDADAVVLALPAYAAGRLLDAAGVGHGRALADVVYLPSVTVSLAYRAAQLGTALSGTGFVVAPDLPGDVRACTYTSAKFPQRAPPDHVLLRAFMAPVDGDGDAAARAHADLARILGIRGEALWSRVFRWTRGLPRYRAGHAQHVTDARRRLERLPPLAIAGAGYDGAAVSACVRSGRDAGRAIARLLAR